MYEKYNAALRQASGVQYLIDKFNQLCKGNNYATTIHAINSCVLKLSKLTQAVKVWRGFKGATLPKEFFQPNSSGVRGGIEYGFSSTTTDRAQAVSYAQGSASTIFEMQMGMVDRGADLSWLSQYPHEKEVLLPPLTGIEALTSDVEGSILVINSRLSLNLAAQTLEQVLSRRRKMLMDMATGIELEIREGLRDSTEARLVTKHTSPLVDVALRILRKALEYGAYKKAPDWFNNDDNFATVMQETLYLQRTLINEVRRLDTALDKPELVLQGWSARGPARMLLLAGWAFARTLPIDFCIDLRDASLTPSDGEQLAQLMLACPRLTSVDVRGNESLDEAGTNALCAFMASQRVTKVTSVPRSVLGVTPAKSRLDVPKATAWLEVPQISPFELRLLCAELEANNYSEGISADMGDGKKGGRVTQLNRRGQSAAEWKPLIWAAKDNNLLVARQLIANGCDVNEQESVQDKGHSGYAPIHWACQKGHEAMLTLLLDNGASPIALDKHGNSARSLAEKKGHKGILSLLDSVGGANAHGAKAGSRPAFSAGKMPLPLGKQPSKS